MKAHAPKHNPITTPEAKHHLGALGDQATVSPSGELPFGPSSEGRSPACVKDYAASRKIDPSLQFVEHPVSGYASRTKRNAEADATIAIAKDFNSAGERLTKRVVQENRKTYIPLAFSSEPYDESLVAGVVDKLNGLGKSEISLNIAGNGIYTFKGARQASVDAVVMALLQRVIEHPGLRPKIVSICSGGQTGVDEAGIKAAINLGIPSRITAPKGWVFRDSEGRDHADEAAFKARFLSHGDGDER